MLRVGIELPTLDCTDQLPKTMWNEFRQLIWESVIRLFVCIYRMYQKSQAIRNVGYMAKCRKCEEENWLEIMCFQLQALMDHLPSPRDKPLRSFTC
jgi:hypothetical protein